MKPGAAAPSRGARRITIHAKKRGLAPRFYKFW